MAALYAVGAWLSSVTTDLAVSAGETGADAAGLAFIFEQFADDSSVVRIGVFRHDECTT